MKNVRIRVRENCVGNRWWYSIYINGRESTLQSDWYDNKGYTIRYAKKTAKRIGIPYDPEIIKQHGC